jgi:hypothetical protein
MAVKGEEVASAIDAGVRESMERMVAEIRSSIEDVRTAVDSQLKAALQSVQADVNSVVFLPQIRKSVEELEASYAADAAAAPSGAGAARVKAAVQAIERGKSQVDVLNSLLEQSLEFGSRAALLILRGDTFSGWKGAGFSAHGGNDEAIKRFNAAPGLIPELDRVLRDEHVVEWDGRNLATRFGVGASERAVLVPMVIKDKVAAAVYVDAVAADVKKFDSDAIELLVFTTGLLVDTLAIRKKIPSPSLRSGEGAGESRAATETPRAAAAQPAAAPPPPAPAVAPPPVPKRTDAATVAITASQMRDMMAAPPRPAPVAPAPPAPTPTMEAPKPAHGEDRPATQYIPPPNLARGGSAAAQSDDAKKHDEARRFARLLVSEIKLYNESKVDQGRRNKDLYERLKDDIDRSRQMYEDRIDDDVRKVSNYFYDELVRILADGRADALGL